jgi:hypothetical protein
MAPYSLVAIHRDGRETVVMRGHNPTEVGEANTRVARNPKEIARIELRDLSGVLNTYWAYTWE